MDVWASPRIGITRRPRTCWLQVPVDPTTGFSTQMKNAGTVENKGIELSLTWNDKIGKDFQYNVGWNMAYNHNEVTKVKSNQTYNNGGKDLLAQNTGYMARFEEGHPIGYFWGYKTEGVMQIRQTFRLTFDKNCKGNAANSKQGTSIKPGDLKFVDVNGDGVINDDDIKQTWRSTSRCNHGYHSRCILQRLRPFCYRFWNIGQQVAGFVHSVSSPMVSSRTSLQRCMTTGMVRELPTSIHCSPT